MMRIRWARPVAVALAAAGAGGAAAQAPSTLPGGASSLQEAYENWTVICVQQTAKHCVLSQQQADQQTRQRVLAIQFEAPSGDRLNGTLVLPFGLAFDPGVRLRVDDSAVGPPLRFRTCLPIGCIVPLSFDAGAIAALRKGTTLKAEVTTDAAKTAAFTISLKGFPAALDRTAALSK